MNSLAFPLFRRRCETFNTLVSSLQITNARDSDQLLISVQIVIMICAVCTQSMITDIQCKYFNIFVHFIFCTSRFRFR